MNADDTDLVEPVYQGTASRSLEFPAEILRFEFPRYPC